MALSSAKQQEIIRKVELGLPLIDPNPEAQKFYNTVREIKRKAELKIPLINPTYWGTALYGTYAKTGNTPAGGTGQGSNIGQSGTGGTGGYTNNPPLDTTPPVIIDDTNNAPTTTIGSGANSPLNRLELNSVVAVVVGLFFVRGAFKLLTKLF